MSKIPPPIPSGDYFRIGWSPDTFDLGEGWAVEIEAERDDDFTVFDDGDWFGELAWVDDGPYRPDGFNGAARKLHPNGWACDSPVWWQPPADILAMSPDRVDDMARTVTRLLADGYMILTVTLSHDGCPVETESLGAVDWGDYSDDRTWIGWDVASMAEECRSRIVDRLARRLGTAPAILEGVNA